MFENSQIDHKKIAQVLIQQGLQSNDGIISLGGRSVSISVDYIDGLKEVMKTAQSTTVKYAAAAAKPLAPDQQVRMDTLVEESKAKFSAAADELANILVYLFSPTK